MVEKSNTKKFKLIEDRVILYRNFTLDLLYNICDYYLDKETLYCDVDIENHFNWCFGKTCDKYKQLGQDFKSNNELCKYFKIYYYENIYRSTRFDNKENITKRLFEKFWNRIFDYEKITDKTTISVLAEVYTIFDKSYVSKLPTIITDENDIILEKEKRNIKSENINIEKFNNIYDYKYANNTIALAELKNGNFLFVNKSGIDDISNISDDDINNMDSYIRAFYFNQLIKEKKYYCITPFTYSKNKYAKATTIKGDTVYINKFGEVVKYNTKS